MGRSKTSELALVYSAAAAGLLLRAVSRRNAASSSGSSRKILLPAFVLVMLYRLCSMLRRATGEPPEEITSGGAPLQSYVERHCVSFVLVWVVLVVAKLFAHFPREPGLRVLLDERWQGLLSFRSATLTHRCL